MIHTYEFADRNQFVAFLKSRATEHRNRAAEYSARSHVHTEQTATANAYDTIARMVERSNLEALPMEGAGIK